MEMVLLVLREGLSVFLAEADWQWGPGAPFASVLASGMDVVARRDRSSFLGLGATWVRRTDDTLHLMERVANRVYAAWDQAVFTEEVSFSAATCCTSNELLLPTRWKYDRYTAMRELSAEQDECVERNPPAHALPPPLGSSIFQNWDGNKPFNEVARNERSRCGETRCRLDLVL